MRAINTDDLLPKLYSIKQAEEQIYGKASWGFVNRCIHVVEDAPTIEPERKKGKWIDTGSGQECSACHEIQYGYDNFRNFCENCGADMRGDSDGSD